MNICPPGSARLVPRATARMLQARRRRTASQLNKNTGGSYKPLAPECWSQQPSRDGDHLSLSFSTRDLDYDANQSVSVVDEPCTCCLRVQQALPGGVPSGVPLPVTQCQLHELLQVLPPRFQNYSWRVAFDTVTDGFSLHGFYRVMDAVLMACGAPASAAVSASSSKRDGRGLLGIGFFTVADRHLPHATDATPPRTQGTECATSAGGVDDEPRERSSASGSAANGNATPSRGSHHKQPIQAQEATMVTAPPSDIGTVLSERYLATHCGSGGGAAPGRAESTAHHAVERTVSPSHSERLLRDSSGESESRAPPLLEHVHSLPPEHGVLGCFTPVIPSLQHQGNQFFGTSETFVFRVNRSERGRHVARTEMSQGSLGASAVEEEDTSADCVQVYFCSQSENSSFVVCAPDFLGIGGGKGGAAITVDDSLRLGTSSRHCSTFDSPSLWRSHACGATAPEAPEAPEPAPRASGRGAAARAPCEAPRLNHTEFEVVRMVWIVCHTEARAFHGMESAVKMPCACGRPHGQHLCAPHAASPLETSDAAHQAPPHS